MHRTTIVLDQEKLSQARAILGTRGIRETVERALDEVIAHELRRAAYERLTCLDGLELDDPGVMASAWR